MNGNTNLLCKKPITAIDEALIEKQFISKYNNVVIQVKNISFVIAQHLNLRIVMSRLRGMKPHLLISYPERTGIHLPIPGVDFTKS